VKFIGSGAFDEDVDGWIGDLQPFTQVDETDAPNDAEFDLASYGEEVGRVEHLLRREVVWLAHKPMTPILLEVGLHQ
jgi:hypothetical protein